MVGGKRAFDGESVLDTLHAIARSEPQPVGEINAELPADLERIVKKCLAAMLSQEPPYRRFRCRW